MTRPRTHLPADRGDISVDPATRADLPFLEQMLFEAAFWRPTDERPSVRTGLKHPELRRWLADWGARAGDTGLIARLPSGLELGAAWYRFWTDDNHAHGFISADVPELAIAVVPNHRGRGIGASLLRGLLTTASEDGIAQVSLSVEKDNPAQHLYRRTGFREVGMVGNAWTMVAVTSVSSAL